MRRAALYLLTTIGLSGGLLTATADAHEATKDGVTVLQPWTRATPGGARNGAAFGEIRMAAGKADSLIGAKSSAATRVEIHNHVMENGVAKMRRVDSIHIPAGQSALLSPSGYHIMLFNLRAPLQEGSRMPLTLVFEKAGEIAVEASVEAVGALGPHGIEHQPRHPGAAKEATPHTH
jgi:copper(I)-binding protein